jgi:sulfofructose kinase
MNELAAIDVLAAGVSVVDVFVRVPEQVSHGEKHEVRELLVQGGGPAATAACVLASLGWRTGFITRIGDNPFSVVARDDLRRHGVLADFFIPDATASPVIAIVQADPRTGERTIFYTRKDYHVLKAADVPVEAVQHSKLVLVDGYEPEAALAMLDAASKAGHRSVLDVEIGDRDSIDKLLALSTDCILPLSAARALTGEETPEAALHRLVQWTSAQLIVTDGTRGSWALTPEGILHQPAIAVDAVDTTGCGDAFHGAYAAALLDGLPLRFCMEFAAWVAAQVALKLGGRTNLPTRDSIRKSDLSMLSPELRAHFLKPLWNQLTVTETNQYERPTPQ